MGVTGANPSSHGGRRDEEAPLISSSSQIHLETVGQLYIPLCILTIDIYSSLKYAHVS